MMRTYQVRMSQQEMKVLLHRASGTKMPVSCSNAIRLGLGFPLLWRGGVPKAKAAAERLNAQYARGKRL